MDLVNELKSIIEEFKDIDATTAPTSTTETIDDIMNIRSQPLPKLDKFIDIATTMLKKYIDSNWEYFKYAKSMGYITGAYLCPGLNRYSHMAAAVAVEEILLRVNNYRKLKICKCHGNNNPLLINITWS